MTYTLERKYAGVVHTQGPFKTRRLALGLAGYVLTDNGAAQYRDAMSAVNRLADAPDGTWVEAFGYAFRLVAS